MALLFLVLDGVEESRVIGSPDDGADAFHLARQYFVEEQILDVQRVLAEAGGVGGIGEPAGVVGNVGVADGKEWMPLGQLVAVEDYLLRRILGRIGLAMGSAVDCVLLTLLVRV